MKNQKSKIKNQKFNEKLKRCLTFGFLLVILPFTFCLFNLESVSAETRTITISPPTTELTVKPGQSYSGTISLINQSQESFSFTAGVNDFVVKDSLGTPTLVPTEKDNPYTGAAWISLSPTELSLEPGESKEISYTIDVPVNALPGGRYAAAIATDTKSNISTQTGAVVKTQIGSLFILRVSGPTAESAEARLATFAFQEYGPILFEMEIRNTGNVHIAPKASLFVTDFMGRTVAQQEVGNSRIFPGARRSGLSSLGTNVMFGPYKLSLIGTYGQKNIDLLATSTVWIVPWRILIVFVLVIVALILSLKLWRKGVKRINADSQQINADVESTPIA